MSTASNTPVSAIDWPGVATVQGTATDWFGDVPDTEALPVVEPIAEPTAELGEVEFAPGVTAQQQAEFLARLAEPVRPIEADHQAELTQIDLPPARHLFADALLVPPPWTWQQVLQWCRGLPWLDLAVWLLGVAQLALGVALGYLLMLILLGLIR